MRLRQTMTGFGDAEVAILRVGAQAIGFEILFGLMAMRCFGRALKVALETLFAALAAAFGLAAATRPFDLMVLRAEDLAVVPRPVHFFFTAVLAAAFDVAFCLAIFLASPDRLIGGA